ncbi:hypothetical protein RND81_13G117300 [Saponaria officinalis]|uniref:RING-type E3 ubiquitin transferase n=1 Tax=Saponaria officinalis TaxID=3572 RepID=A0AAW1H4V8_SAPOF
METYMLEEIDEITRTRAKVIEDFPKNCTENSRNVSKLMSTRVKRDLKVMEMARKRAKTENRTDFKKVLEETDLELFSREASIFIKKMKVDPRVEAVERVVVKEEELGLIVCGVCQEEVDVGEMCSKTTCMHKFHGFCLWKWLDERNKTCPLCRFRILN